VSNVEQILSVPGLGFAEMGPGDLGLVLGYKQVPREQQFPFMTDRRSMTYENGERSGPIDPLFAPEGASYRLSNDRMRYDQPAQWAMET
jgi:hypothetical protein